MKIAGVQLEARFLRTRIARRIFLLFVACALLPVGAFAALAYRQVTAQLEREARDELHAEAKAHGMSIYERIFLVDGALRLAEAALEAAPARSVEDVLRAIPDSVRTHFRSVALSDIAADPAGKSRATLPTLTSEERIQLSEGETLFRIEQSDTQVRLFLVRAMRNRNTRLIEAELEPTFIFAPDSLRETSHLIVVDSTERLIFSDLSPTFPAETLAQRGRRIAGQHVGSWVGTRDSELAGAWDLYLHGSFHVKPVWTIIVTRPQSDVLGPLYEFRKIFPLVALLSLWIVLFLSLSQIRRSLVPIELLKTATAGIAARNLDVRVDIQSTDEFRDLGESFNEMARSISQHVTSMGMVNAIGAALSAERDTNRLLELIIQGAMRLARANVGTLYLVSPNGELVTGLVRAAAGGQGASGGIAKSIPSPLAKNLAEQVAMSGRRSEHEHRASGGEHGGRPSNRDSSLVCVFLTIPLRNHETEIIGVLQLMNVRDPETGRVSGFSEQDCEVAESLASQAAVALTKQSLVDSFKALFEGLVQLIVRAIDEKSPYTGDHCRRVPILTELIAQAACETTDGPLKSFSLTDEERYELRIGALLHDCGKVTTPVHVVDKATKLETLFDRIHLVDTRFEILKRDAEIRMLRRLAGFDAASTPLEGEAGAALGRELHQLEEEQKFLQACNIGSEHMSANDIEQVRAIATNHRWRTPDGQERACLSPEEIENLTVTRGTLNEREREIINYHVVATINMLQDLPYPKSLRRVPEIAGAHHERLDGSGYPKGLNGAQVSMQARILGLADIFEALTAKDRPYKRGRTLREALSILRAMRDDGQIDSDLFDLFVNQKIYLRYAMECLSPEQIDEGELGNAAPALLLGRRC